eukprot:645167-Alexandrium_andersonii.AAC.1
MALSGGPPSPRKVLTCTLHSNENVYVPGLGLARSLMSSPGSESVRTVAQYGPVEGSAEPELCSFLH